MDSPHRMLKDADLLEVRSWTWSHALEYETVIGYKCHKNMAEIGRHSCCMTRPSSQNCSRGPSQSHLPTLDLSLYRLFYPYPCSRTQKRF